MLWISSKIINYVVCFVSVFAKCHMNIENVGFCCFWLTIVCPLLFVKEIGNLLWPTKWAFQFLCGNSMAVLLVNLWSCPVSAHTKWTVLWVTSIRVSRYIHYLLPASLSCKSKVHWNSVNKLRFSKFVYI